MLKLIEIKLPLGEEPDDVDRVIGFTTCSKFGLDALITQQSHFFGQDTVSSQKLPVQSARYKCPVRPCFDKADDSRHKKVATYGIGGKSSAEARCSLSGFLDTDFASKDNAGLMLL